MQFLSNSLASHKRNSLTAPSTLDWRAWWRIESERHGTDWPTLLARAAGIVAQLYTANLNVSGPSS